jgi:tetratricopeptide (TPR) repeat protein
MKLVKKVLFTMVLAGAQVWGQANPQEPLREAYAFEKQGQFDKAIAVAKELTDSGRSSGGELGRAWVVLGLAYSEQGRFMEAQDAFDRSLHVLDQDPQFGADYATALQAYGSLYNSAGQTATAAQLWRKALDLRQRSGDHLGTIRLLTRLAELALGQNRIREARKYLQSAAEEMKFAPALTDDDLAMTYESQAGLALAEGHSSVAIAGFQRSLELCKQIHGERNWITGWDYMLLGEAYTQSGDIEKALANMSDGLAILEEALGNRNPKYFAAQIAYSQVLNRAGLHVQAAKQRTAAEQAEKDFSKSQCVGCTINVAAFR